MIIFLLPALALLFGGCTKNKNEQTNQEVNPSRQGSFNSPTQVITLPTQ